MSEHVSDHLSAYLDDDVDASARVRVEAHLQTCGDCRSELDALRRIVAYAGTIASEDAPPSRDLWPGIAARIEAPRVASFADGAARRATGAAPEASPSRRLSFTIAQLAAAAVILMAVSGATAWFLRGPAPAAGTPPLTSPVVQAELESTPPTNEVRLANFADAQYNAAVTDLERTLHERRNDLNPRTVEILERNLRLIDAAIAQARQALEEDPGNTYLNRHLVESRHRKLELLRRATAITEGD